MISSSELFHEWVKSLPETHWAKCDISACRLGWDAAAEKYIKMLADCYRATGADPDGREDWRLAEKAMTAVNELRDDLDRERESSSEVDAQLCGTCEGRGRLYQRVYDDMQWIICHSCNGEGVVYRCVNKKE